MVSVADDSSIDDNVSSIGESTWDIIDDASAATSDDEERDLNRHYTASSDGHEEDQDDSESLRRTDTSDESQDNESVHGHPDFHRERLAMASGSKKSHDTNEGGEKDHDKKERTEVGTIASHSNAEYSIPSSIIFQEPEIAQADSIGWVDVSHTLKMFERDQVAQISQYIRTEAPPSKVVATIRQTMSTKGLEQQGKEPYKVLYVGDIKAEQPVIQKISEALESSFHTVFSDTDTGSSEYSIIPISAFGEEKSPEVVLVDNRGPKISVQKCTSASFSKEDGGKTNISLMLNYRDAIHSIWNGKSYILSVGCKLPDIAVVYASEHEDMNAKSTRMYAKTFMARHGVPVIVVSERPAWVKPYEVNTLDYRTPHLCLESRDPSSVAPRVLSRLPIDLTTFLEIDVHQMGRNLACLASIRAVSQAQRSRSTHGTLNSSKEVYESSSNFQVMQGKLSNVIKDALSYFRTGAAPEAMLAFVIGSMLLISVLLFAGIVIPFGTLPVRVNSTAISRVPIGMPSTAPTSISNAVQNLHNGLKHKHNTKTSHHNHPSPPAGKATSKDTSISITHSSSDLAAFLLDSNTFTPNRSDKFNVQVVGDCHIVLRPPHWYAQLKKPPPLLFKVSRQNKTLSHHFSTLFEGVHALRLPREDAHGPMSISVWTTSKPKINETFHIDFGTAWLNLAGWKKAALAVTKQIRNELDSAQTGLELFYGQTTTGVQSFVRDVSVIADSVLREADNVRATAINQTAKSTELVVAQTKELSQRVQQRSSNISSRFRRNSLHMRQDISVCARRVSSTVSYHARILSQAITGIDVTALKDELREFPVQSLRGTQKKALRMWWNIRGLPERKATKGGTRLGSKTPRGRSRKGSNR
ncbi:hypothetical protein MMC06_000361 [Schaereria dolodes]|nr:hypothetical protein [Schaereria dolodes]